MGWTYTGGPSRAIKRRVLERDGHRCYLRGPRCIGHATQVDHVVNVAAGGTHDEGNLAAICAPCHEAKTQGERTAGIRAGRAKALRKAESHPGDISPGA